MLEVNAIQSYLNNRYPETGWRVCSNQIIWLTTLSGSAGMLLYTPLQNYEQADFVAYMLLQAGIFKKSADKDRVNRGESLKSPLEGVRLVKPLL